MAQAKLGRVKQLRSAVLLYWLTSSPPGIFIGRSIKSPIVRALECPFRRSCAMTRFSRSVFSHSARLFLAVTSFARPVLQTSLRRLARIEDHVLEYCARRQTRRGPERPLDLAPLRSAAQETAAHLTPARPRRGSGLRKLAARTLGIGITTVILLGLIGVQETRAQVITTTALYSPAAP